MGKSDVAAASAACRAVPPPTPRPGFERPSAGSSTSPSATRAAHSNRKTVEERPAEGAGVRVNAGQKTVMVPARGRWADIPCDAFTEEEYREYDRRLRGLPHLHSSAQLKARENFCEFCENIGNAVLGIRSCMLARKHRRSRGSEDEMLLCRRGTIFSEYVSKFT